MDNVKIAGSFASIVVLVLVRLTDGASLKPVSDGTGVVGTGVVGVGVTSGVGVGVTSGVGVGVGVGEGEGVGEGVGVEGTVTVKDALTPSTVTS